MLSFFRFVLTSTFVTIALCVALMGQTFGPPGNDVSIMAHVQNKGWIGPFTNGQIAGTVGQSLRLEAVKITASGGRHICYQAHVQNVGGQS